MDRILRCGKTPVSDASEESSGVSRESNPPPPPSSGQPNVPIRAVFIGINYRGTGSELHGCINDVNNIKAYLSQELGGLAWTSDNSRTLTDDTPGSLPLRQNMLDAFDWLVNGPQPARLFVHYSGHGSQVADVADPDGKKDEDDGKDEVLVPLDYLQSQVITDDELKTRVVNKVQAGSRLVAVFDCCNSGTALDQRYTLVTASFIKPISGPYKLHQLYEFLQYPETAGQVILLSGCLDSQTSADAFIGNKSQGAMTWGLLDALKSLPAAQRTWPAVLSKLQSTLKAQRYTQVPQLSFGRLPNDFFVGAPVRLIQ